VGDGTERVSGEGRRGGRRMRHEPTMLTSYQQADAETVRRVVLEPMQRLIGAK